MKNRKTIRFGMVMGPVDQRSLEFLKEHEKISAAAVVRRLIWSEAKRQGYGNLKNINEEPEAAHAANKP